MITNSCILYASQIYMYWYYGWLSRLIFLELYDESTYFEVGMTLLPLPSQLLQETAIPTPSGNPVDVQC